MLTIRSREAEPPGSPPPGPGAARPLLLRTRSLPSQSDPAGLVVIRDAETETLLRTYANPLFRAAALDLKLVRNVLLRDVAIDSFVSTGNQCSSPPARR